MEFHVIEVLAVIASSRMRLGAATAGTDAELPTGGSFDGNNLLSLHAFTNIVTLAHAGEAGFRGKLVEASRGTVRVRALEINAPLHP